MSTVPQTLAAFFPRQLRALSTAGFEVHAISSPGIELDRLGSDCEIETHGIPMERPPHPLRDVISLRRLYTLMRRIRPHIVHAHTPKAGLLGMAAARLAGVPVRLYTVHGLPLMTRTGLMRSILERAEQSSAALSTQSYSVSESVREDVVSMGLCPAAKMFTLGDGSCAGVSLDRFQPSSNPAEIRAATRTRLGVPQNSVLVSFVGRISKDKGIAVLADAWRMVRTEQPDAHLLLAGEEDTTDPISDEARNWLREESTVHLAGTVPYEQTPAIYTASDLCVLPSFREGLSQVALEAAAMGVPIVASKVSGLVNSVADGLTGILVPPSDPRSLADALIDLASHPGLRMKLGQAAMDRVRAKFSEERVNRLWMAEYRSMTADLLQGEAILKSNSAAVLHESKLQ